LDQIRKQFKLICIRYIRRTYKFKISFYATKLLTQLKPMILSFRKRLNDMSIAKKLHFIVGIMAILVTIELFNLYFAVATLSAIRSFVAGEEMWSKAEKDAAASLNQYILSHNKMGSSQNHFPLICFLKKFTHYCYQTKIG
jgi:hypothetical protein